MPIVCNKGQTFKLADSLIYDGNRPLWPYNEKTKFLSQSGAEILTRPLLRRGCAIRDGANLFRSSSYLLCSFVITVILYSKQFFSHKCHIKYTFRGLIWFKLSYNNMRKDHTHPISGSVSAGDMELSLNYVP